MKPRLLDLFCGAGGATCGYQRAGFYVVGVDVKPQPNYCGDKFFQADALEVLAAIAMDREVDGLWPNATSYLAGIHTSPPCQGYAGVTAWRGNRDDHPRLIGDVREHLQAIGLPYVIENVPDARRELIHPLLLCGTAFGLPIRRHRYFELSWPWQTLNAPCQHCADDHSFDHGGKQPESVYRAAMGCDWMTVGESREAIPPVYTEHIGTQLLSLIAQESEAA